MFLNIFLGLIVGVLISIIFFYFFDKKKVEQKNNENISLKIKIAEQEQIIKNLKENLEKQKDDVVLINEKFENIANKILKEKTKDFLEQNNTSLDQILTPVREDIKNFKEKIDRYYDNENKDKASLKTEIKNLIDLNKKVSDDANNLTNALKGDSKMQGNWGEIQLEKILDLVGLKRGIHYEMQESFTDENNKRLQPDCVIKLPDDKNLIIDSKVSLVGYERYFSSTTDEDRAEYLKDHLQSIYNHIDGLSKKNYSSINIKQPDFVLMFIPIESGLSLAIQNDFSLMERALNKNIILTSVSTLIATLRTISYIWKQEDLKKNFMEIAKIGGDLYDKTVSFVTEIENMGKHIYRSREAYHDIMKKLTTGTRRGDTIIGKAEKLRELGVKTEKKFSKDVLEKIDTENEIKIK
jgi:DNA recombination protein RmuC